MPSSSSAQPVSNPSDREREQYLARLLSDYGDGADGMSPTRAQWSRILDGPAREPITLINLFKLREPGNDRDGSPASDSAPGGAGAMLRYAAVSGPALERVGGQFLLMAPVESAVMGEEEDWDLVAIGKYPTRDALFRLFDDADYVAAFAHRRAALERQRVWLVKG